MRLVPLLLLHSVLGIGHVLILFILILFCEATLAFYLLLGCFTAIGLIDEAGTTAKTRSAPILKIRISVLICVQVGMRSHIGHLGVALLIIDTSLWPGIVDILLN